MVCSFLASTSVIIALNLLNVLARFKDFQEVVAAFNIVGANNSALLVIKIGILIICYFISFYGFTICIRFLNFAALAFQSTTREDGSIQPENVLDLFKRAYVYHTIAMRAYYYSFPLLLWILSPIAMVITAILVVVVLIVQDHSGKAFKTKKEAETV
jgi:uncharacterized membrane protein